MEDLEQLLEQYRVADLSTLQQAFIAGRHRKAETASSEEGSEEPSTYHRAGARRAPGACAG